MRGKKGIRCRGKFVSLLLVLALLLSLCTGCKNPFGIEDPTGGNSDDRAESDGSNKNTGDTEPEPLETILPEDDLWEDVITGAKIETLNVVLVIDTSFSTLKNDTSRNCLESACMFLNTLYASASKRAERLPGSKGAFVDVILYNDGKPSLCAEKLMDISLASTLGYLKGFIRDAPENIPAESGDDALAEALDKATELLYNHTKGQETLSERSVILLFTDGYTGYAGARPASSTQMPPVDAASSATTSVSGESGNETAGDASVSYASYGAASMPNFGDAHQKTLENALQRAKEHNYTVYVLMLNLESSNGNGAWEQFEGIAEYTKRNLMPELMKVIYSHQNVFAGMSMSDFKWPEDYVVQIPTFINDPIYGFGIFSDPNSNSSAPESPYGGGSKVNYLMATSPEQVMEFYTTLAACMLSGSSAKERNPGVAQIEEASGSKEYYAYNIKVPNSGVSALMCFFFSKDGINDVIPKGPDPDNPDEQIDYKVFLRKNQENDGWANNGTMRNDWYETPKNSKQFNVAGLTIINPQPGLWTIYVRGKDGKNRSLHTYATLVSGTETKVKFAQGDDRNPENWEHYVTSGEFTAQVKLSGDNGQPLSKEFYEGLGPIRCDALRIPPWLPVSEAKDTKGLEKDIKDLMSNFPAWMEKALSGFETGQFLTQMSGGSINFSLDEDNRGNPILKGRFDAPLPGLYYLTLNMTSGENLDQIDYSQSFWVSYKAKTDYQVIGKANKDTYLRPPYLPEAWGKISNADVSDIPDIEWTIDPKSVKLFPPNLATWEVDSRDSRSLVFHCGKNKTKNEPGKLTLDVTTKYGDKFTLEYDFIVN